MKFELCGKTKAKLIKVDIQSAKRGQTEVVPAVALTFKIALPNDRLNMLDKALLPFLYERGTASASTQAALDGVDVVSDMPSLTRAAARLGTLGWDDEQPGSGLVIYQGVTGDGDIRLRDGTLTVKKIAPHEGGARDGTVAFYTEEIDADTLGELGVLKSHELDIEISAPAVATQTEIEGETEERDDETGDDSPFPFSAGGAGDEPESPFGPAEALAQSVAAENVPVTHRRSKLAQVK